MGLREESAKLERTRRQSERNYPKCNIKRQKWETYGGS